MQKRVLPVTGAPGVGKTTILAKAATTLKASDYCVGGIISREAREGELRVDFEILDLNSGGRGRLAHVKQKEGPQVGKYHVNMEDLNGLGAQAVMDVVDNCDVIAVDEVGPMELFSATFKEAVRKALESRKHVIAVVQWKAKDRLIDEAKRRLDLETFTVSQENRDELPETIAQKTLDLFKWKTERHPLPFSEYSVYALFVGMPSYLDPNRDSLQKR